MKIRMKYLLCRIDGCIGRLSRRTVDWSLDRYANTYCELYRYIGVASAKIGLFFFNRQLKKGLEILLWFDTHGKKAQA